MALFSYLHQCLKLSFPIVQHPSLLQVVGPSGCGKTQFCTMMAVQAAFPLANGGLDKRVLYIDTEGAFSAERLLQVAKSRCSAIAPDNLDFLAETLDRVSVVVESSCDSLLKRLKGLEETIIKTEIGLVIVDSIASLIRKEFDAHSSNERSDLLAVEAALLKYIAESFSIPVLVTNQVTTKLEDLDAPDGGSFVTAALGNTWSHSVNTRLLLEYLPASQERMVTIMKSPLSAKSQSPFAITEHGLVSTGAAEIPGSMVTINPRITVKSSANVGDIEAYGSRHGVNAIMLAQQ